MKTNKMKLACTTAAARLALPLLLVVLLSLNLPATVQGAWHKA